MCPTLVAGTAFGFLRTNETHSENLPCAAYSRVSNIAGAGFSVEAFSAASFTAADGVVAGLHRLTASGSEPAYQTSCFVANISPLGTSTGVTTAIDYTLYSSAGAVLGSGSVPLIPESSSESSTFSRPQARRRATTTTKESASASRARASLA